jgi:polyisoprenoid-binding protein YceI
MESSMKKMTFALALTLSSLALASSWEIDSAHAATNFAVRHMMLSHVKGTLGQVTGKVELDDKDITKSVVSASIDAKGVDTKNQKRDDHLRSKEFLDVEKFPTITFKSTKIEKGAGDSQLKVTGDLTIHGVTKSVTLDTEVTGEVANPFTKVVTRAISATTSINRKDFGLNWQVPMANNGVVAGEEVKISIEAELMRKDAAAAKK